MKKIRVFGSFLLTCAALASCTFGMKEVEFDDAKNSFTSANESPYKSVAITGSYAAKTKSQNVTLNIDSTFTIKGASIVGGYSGASSSEIIAYTVFSMGITTLNTTYQSQGLTPKYYLGTGDIPVIVKIDVNQLVSSSKYQAKNSLNGTYKYNTYGLITSIDETQKIIENENTTTITTKIDLKYSE